MFFVLGCVQTGVDPGGGYTCEVLDRTNSISEEGIGEVSRIGFQCWETADGSGYFAPTVEDLDGWCVGDESIGRFLNFCDIFAFCKHAEGSTEGLFIR